MEPTTDDKGAFRRTRTVFEACLDLDDAGRAAALRELPEGERGEVLELLAIADREVQETSRYVPTRVIDTGGRGIVMRARDEKLGDDVVLKMFRVRADRAATATDLLARYVDHSQSLRGVIPWLASAVTGSRIAWVVTEDRTDCPNLTEWIRDFGPSSTERIAVFRSIAETMQEAPDGLRARWPKPRQVLVDRLAPRSLLTDVGVLAELAVHPGGEVRESNDSDWHVSAAALFPDALLTAADPLAFLRSLETDRAQ